MSEQHNVESIYGLTPMQEGMLFHAQLQPDSDLYVEQMTSYLCGPFDIKKFRMAIDRVVARYSIFRTAFLVDKKPKSLQIVLRRVSMSIESVLLSTIQKDTKCLIEEICSEYAKKELRKKFDFRKPPLSRISLINLEDGRHFLIWTFHHIILDGWSLPIILGDLMNLYENPEATLAPVVSFSKYIEFIENWNKNAAIEFWKTYWDGFEQPSLLTYSSKKNLEVSDVYIEKNVSLGAKSTELLSNKSAAIGVTANCILQFCWAQILSLLTFSRDISFGAIISGRPTSLQGIEGMVGLFINVVPIRINLNDDQTINEQLHNHNEAFIRCQENGFLPLPEIQECTSLGQGVKFFDTLMVFENYPNGDQLTSQRRELKFEDVKVREKTNFPLTIIISMMDTINFRFLYDRTYISDKRMTEIADNFLYLIDKYLIDGANKLVDFVIRPLVKADVDIKDIITDSSDSFLVRFYEYVIRNPEKVAVKTIDGSWTYREIDDWSDQIANIIRNAGVRAGGMVGIFMDRKAILIPCLIAVWKCGAAYIPVDPSYPGERIRFIIDDAQLNLLLTIPETKSKCNNLLTDVVRPCITLNEFSISSNNCQTNSKPIVNNYNDLAYLIYTSGSTGKPKGVEIRHSNLMSLLRWSTTVFNLGKLNGILASTSINFDLSVFEIFCTLYQGGTIVLVDNILEIIDSPLAYSVELINTVPSAVNELLLANAIPRSVKIINLAGELLKQDIVDKIYELGHVESVYDLYGPSEDTTYSSMALREHGGVENIGNPIKGARFHVLDVFRRPVPKGECGELYIEGPGISSGYWRRPELTRQAFLDADPRYCIFPIWYKTGDLVRQLADDRYCIIGRCDYQVKIRGHRIELGEVESAFYSLKGIREVVAVAIDSDEYGKILVVYAIGDERPLSDIKYSLGELIPSYMQPSVVVWIDKLPLTPNGKIDRAALPSVDGGVDISDYKRNSEEALLVRIWSEVLKHPIRDIDPNWFENGGHSLNAVSLLLRIREEFGKSISLQAFFEDPTISGLSIRLLEEGHRVFRIEYPDTVEGWMPASYQQSIIFSYQALNPLTVVYNMPYSFHWKGKLDRTRFSVALDKLFNRHDVFKYRFMVNERVVCFRTDSEAQLSVGWFNAHEEKWDEMIKSFIQPFNLSSGPLVRVNVIEASTDSFLLYLDVHHIIFDGYSFSVAMNDLIGYYMEIDPKPLSVMYSQYALWQHSSDYVYRNSKDQEFWYKEIKRYNNTMILPIDNERDGINPELGDVFSAEWNLIDSDAFRKVMKYYRVTPFVFFMGALALFVKRWASGGNVVFGTIASGRLSLELEPLVGLFVNTLIINLNIDENQTLDEWFQYVRQYASEVLEHQGYPFSHMLSELNPCREVNRNPGFDIMYIMQNMEKTEIRMEDVSVEPYNVIRSNAKFDMTFFISEASGHYKLDLEYRSALFEKETIDLIGQLFMEFCNEIPVNTGNRLSDICIPQILYTYSDDLN